MLSETKEKLDFYFCGNGSLSLQALNGKYLIGQDQFMKFYLYIGFDAPKAGYYDTIYEALDAANADCAERIR